METYEELVWRKPGEERCDWTPMPMPTEKKALAEQEKEEEEAYKEIQSGTNSPIIEGVMTRGDFPQIGGVACVTVGDFPQRNLEPLHTRGLKSDTPLLKERYLVGQAIQNPFMPNSNYANDLEVQMNFLTPIKG
jgi:hypothetical protein